MLSHLPAISMVSPPAFGVMAAVKVPREYNQSPPASLSVASLHQPGAGSLHHLLVHLGVHPGHVVELEQAVGGEGLVAGIPPEPLVAAFAALVAGDLAVAAAPELP